MRTKSQTTCRRQATCWLVRSRGVYHRDMRLTLVHDLRALVGIVHKLKHHLRSLHVIAGSTAWHCCVHRGQVPVEWEVKCQCLSEIIVYPLTRSAAPMNARVPVLSCLPDTASMDPTCGEEVRAPVALGATTQSTTSRCAAHRLYEDRILDIDRFHDNGGHLHGGAYLRLRHNFWRADGLSPCARSGREELVYDLEVHLGAAVWSGRLNRILFKWPPCIRWVPFGDHLLRSVGRRLPHRAHLYRPSPRRHGEQLGYFHTIVETPGEIAIERSNCKQSTSHRWRPRITREGETPALSEGYGPGHLLAPSPEQACAAALSVAGSAAGSVATRPRTLEGVR